MPIYEYRRPDGSTFEILQSITAEPLTEDPETGVPVERDLHAPADHFKGAGFYNTDYGPKKRARETKEAGDKGSSSSSDSGSSTSSSSDSSSKSESKASSTSSTSSSTKSD
jgi:predicted nucleic acid-binding Zn ribbon protein